MFSSVRPLPESRTATRNGLSRVIVSPPHADHNSVDSDRVYLWKPGSEAGGRTVRETLRITLPLPPSVNNQYVTVGKRRVLSREARRFRRSVANLVRDGFTNGLVNQPWIESARGEPLACDLTFFFTTPYRRDLDGGLKIALDALFDALDLDDRYVVSITLTKQIDPLNPRAEIELASIESWQFDEEYVVLDPPGESALNADEHDDHRERGQDDNGGTQGSHE
ncbi:MAG: RusA family crossover junction endodeoxyribonuclease [Thermomicrobiales bacterium]